MRGPRCIQCLLGLALLGLLLLVVAVETVIVDVVNDLVRNVVTNAFASLAEETNLGRGNIILNELWNDPNVLSELLKTDKRIV